jgi:hypothetical protein
LAVFLHAAALAALAARAFARFAASLLRTAGESFRFGWAVEAASFCALTLAHRALVAAMIRARPSALMRRLRLGAAVGIEG